MTKQVKIDIVVDTETLLSEFPNGGEITNHNLIVMTNQVGPSTYQTSYKDKLITEAGPSDRINWKIKSKNGGNPLSLDSYSGDANMPIVFKSKPERDKTDDSAFNGSVNDSLPQETISTTYTFSFCQKKQPSIVWHWDPIIIAPFPPK